MATDIGSYQNTVTDLPNLSDYRYENIFKVYKNSDNTYFYNILKKIDFDSDLFDGYFYTTAVYPSTPWTVVSYNAYGTIDLWWLILVINKIQNPLVLPSTNTVKILKPEYIRTVLGEIKQHLQ